MSLVAVVGATGTGKSAKAIAIADAIVELGGTADIVNCDAMQLYRGMDIGTAKVAVEERHGHPHHLLDVLDVTEEASVARYREDALQTIAQIEARGSVPILVGGSGLYASSVLYAFRFPATDPALRARLEAELAERGSATMHARLAALDPVAAERIGPHNGRRLVRAIEVVELTGEPFDVGLPEESALVRPTILQHERVPRDALVARLDARVEAMWAAGMLDEVARLREQGIEHGTTARQAIGYRQALAELAGECTTSEAIAETQALTRRYARRQVSWFQRYPAAEPMTALAIAESALATLNA